MGIVTNQDNEAVVSNFPPKLFDIQIQISDTNTKLLNNELSKWSKNGGFR